MTDTRVKAIAEMRSEEILDRLKALTLNHSAFPDMDMIEVHELLEVLSQRLEHQQMSFTLSGRPETLALAIARMVTENVSREEMEQIRADVISAVRSPL